MLWKMASQGIAWLAIFVHLTYLRNAERCRALIPLAPLVRMVSLVPLVPIAPLAPLVQFLERLAWLLARI